MKKEYTLRITEHDYQQCKCFLLDDYPKESAVFMLAGRKNIGNTEELIVRRIIRIPKAEYRIQENYHLDISPRAVNGLIALCEENGLGAILCHSHPTNSPYSPSDDRGEKRIAETMWKFLPHAPIGSLLISPTGVRARTWKPSEGNHAVSTITIIGRCVHTINANDNVRRTPSYEKNIYDRQILAFGKGGQEILSKARVGIVGLGGTGSSIAEQVVRMGVLDLVLIDPDTIDPSNITRVYGSYYSDIQGWRARWRPWLKQNRSKVGIIAKHLRRINPGMKINAISDSVVKSEAAQSLLDRDVIFCCTDEHWGRSIVNQIAYQYVIPVINMGVRIDANKGKIRGAKGDVHILRPGKPCLWCYEFLNADRINAESLPPHERGSLLREGYVENIDTAAPSVIPLTTTISGHAVTAFLQLITDFLGQAGNISCLNYYIMEATVNRGHSAIKKSCICNNVIGYGDLKSLPIL